MILTALSSNHWNSKIILSPGLPCTYFGARSIQSQQKKRPHAIDVGPLWKTPGGDLLSHPVAQAVSLALEGLTSVFEMVTGVSPPL